MRVQFSIVGTVERHADVWAEMDAIPQVGDTVALPGLSQAETVVRTVVWYPVVDDEGDDAEPFVYVVVGHPRRM